MPIQESKAIAPVFTSRIAPTPSGYLHKGNGFSFVLSWVLMRLSGGRLILRIDDADTSRARPEFIEDIFLSLEWLGLDWDLGPSGPEDFQKNYSQAGRFAQYEQLLEVLLQQDLLYACNCSRSQIKRQYVDGIYRGRCRSNKLVSSQARPDLDGLSRKGQTGSRQTGSLQAGPRQAWRIAVPEEEVCFLEAGRGERCLPLAEEMGDFAVRRKDGLPAYQIASLADDMMYGVNFIVRGEDLLYSTAAQVFLAQALVRQTAAPVLQEGASRFLQARFLHHGLLLDEQGQKLSKSAGSTALKSLREAGGNPMPVYALVADFLQLSADAAASLSDLLQAAADSKVAKQLLSL